MVFLLLLSATLLAGCGKGNNKSEADNIKADMEYSGEDLKFPSTYEHKSPKVQFNCEIEVPNSVTQDNIRKVLVSGKSYADNASVLSNYVEGKEIQEKHEIPVENGMPEENVYVMVDESIVNVGGRFSFGSKNAKYYSRIGAKNSDNREEFRTDQVSFASKEDAIEAVKSEINKLGFSDLEFSYDAYPISHESMKRIEEKYISEGSMEEKHKKDIWTEEDDAYIVYGYQVKNTLPVFHESMSINHMMAYDTSDATPLQAIYSSRGIENLNVGPVYKFEDADEMLHLKEFEEIAKVVEEKFDSILNDAHYVVNRAKLFQMIRRDEKQKYVAEPVWYFEVVENESSKSVALVNAVTGKEIFLV